MRDTSLYKTYKSDEDKAEVYNHRLGIADRDFDKWKEQAENWWARYENKAMLNQYTPKGHRVNVPTGVATIDSLFSALTAIDVDFIAEAKGRTLPEQAELATAALGVEWEACRVQEDANDAIKDSLIVGIGWVKVAYEYVSTWKTMPRRREDILADIDAYLAQEAAERDYTPTADEIAANIPLEEDMEMVIRDRIVVDYVPWDRIRFDPTARRVTDIRWVAQVTEMSLYEVQENPTFRDYVKRTQGGLKKLDQLKADSTIDLDLLGLMGKPTDDDGRCTVVEMWDFETGTVCTFVKGAKWLLNEQVNPFGTAYEMADRSPFVPLVLRKSTRRVRGVSDMELMAPSLDELNVYRSKLATFVERFVPKVLGPEDGLTDTGKQNLQSPEFGAYVEYAREASAQDFNPMSPPVLPSEVFGLPDRLENSIREATGVNELMRGLFPDRKRTATETAQVVSASSARQSEKRNTLELWFVDIAKRMLTLMQAYYTGDRMTQYVDDTYGNVAWEWTPEDILGEFELSITLTPREARDRQALRDEAMTVLNVVGPFSQPDQNGQSVVDRAALLRWTLKHFGLQNREILELLNLPEEQQMQAMAQQQMMAGQAAAQGGVVDPSMVPGPMDPNALAAAANPGAVPPDIAAAAVGGIGPGVPSAVQQVSESAGVRTKG